jgi:hypothetical protein
MVDGKGEGGKDEAIGDLDFSLLKPKVLFGFSGGSGFGDYTAKPYKNITSIKCNSSNTLRFCEHAPPWESGG